MNMALGVLAASMVLAGVATVGVQAAQRSGQPDRVESVSASSDSPNVKTVDDILASLARRADWAALSPGLQDRIDAADCAELLALDDAESDITFVRGEGAQVASQYFRYTYDFKRNCESVR